MKKNYKIRFNNKNKINKLYIYIYIYIIKNNYFNKIIKFLRKCLKSLKVHC